MNRLAESFCYTLALLIVFGFAGTVLLAIAYFGGLVALGAVAGFVVLWALVHVATA